MTKVGIDSIAFYTSRYAIALEILAKARGIDPDKFKLGLGQYAMSVPPPGEDIVTMGANAAFQATFDIDLTSIELLLFATESSIDQSKAAGLFVHELLGLSSRCRVIELKQACYAGTAGLQLARYFLQQHPNKKVLLIASDIARYGLATTGESSQGCGAVAMILSTDPRIIAFDIETGIVTESVMDFWRPNYLDEALVEGKYSSKLYLSMLERSWLDYVAQKNRHLCELSHICYHSPVPRLVEKAHQHLYKINQQDITTNTDASLIYNRQIGNTYTASLYLSFISLLENEAQLLDHKRIGFYSYGSGCVAEFFSGIIQPNYRTSLKKAFHQRQLTERYFLNYEEYAAFYTFHYVKDGSLQTIPLHRVGNYRLSKLENHKRIYERTWQTETIKPVPQIKTAKLNDKETILKISAPGKLILSGEHSVVYGEPALAMAINRFVTATVTKEPSKKVYFDLSDLAHRSQFSFHALDLLKSNIKKKYHRFIQGDFSIREVLQKPFELAQYALGLLAETLNLSLPHGLKIEVKSQIPIGCGMGSSAATIVSVMHAISHYLDLPISRDVLFKLALEAENMQHGHSSGLDLKIATEGGSILMDQDKIFARPLPNFPLYLINSGTPLSTTGQCIEKAQLAFKQSSISKEFKTVTYLMDKALTEQNHAKFKEAIKLNHRLLSQIGVVPTKIIQFIDTIEKMEGAAKICGAGSIIGDKAGALIVMTNEKNKLVELCDHYEYELIAIRGEERGVHAA